MGLFFCVDQPIKHTTINSSNQEEHNFINFTNIDQHKKKDP
jgi:hypothetical protein